jgi:pentatricopeptide repeat domain-containing protein 1
MASLFPAGTGQPDGSSGSSSSNTQLRNAMQQSDVFAAAQSSSAFEAVRLFEGSHSLTLNSMPPEYLQQRSGLLSRMLEAGAALGLCDEVAHDGAQLLDRAAAATAFVQLQATLPLLAAAALQLAATQRSTEPSDVPAALPPAAGAVAAVCGVAPDALTGMCWQLQQLLVGDTRAFSTMRCIKIYLGRIGCR